MNATVTLNIIVKCPACDGLVTLTQKSTCYAPEGKCHRCGATVLQTATYPPLGGFQTEVSICSLDVAHGP